MASIMISSFSMTSVKDNDLLMPVLGNGYITQICNLYKRQDGY